MNIPLFIKRLVNTFAAAKKPKQNHQPSISKLATPENQTEASPPQAQSSQDLLSQALVSEIRSQRKFTIAEAIGRAGGNFMKGESAIPRPLRATAEINQFITTHLPNPGGPVSATLQSWTKEDIRVSRHLDTPLVALSLIIESLLSEPSTFQEFFRQIAIAQSQLTGDRPHFQPPNYLPHPDAAHSHESVKQQLENLLQKLNSTSNSIDFNPSI